MPFRARLRTFRPNIHDAPADYHAEVLTITTSVGTTLVANPCSRPCLL